MKNQLNYKCPYMAQQISQAVLLFDIDLLINLSLRMSTVSAMSLVPNIFIHSAAISELLMLKMCRLMDNGNTSAITSKLNNPQFTSKSSLV